MNIRMDGRVALITGGSLGLGKAMAEAFAAAGASVAIVARRPEVLAEAKAAIEAVADGGAKVCAVAADIRTDAECQRVIDEAQAALGPIDVLVNNAGTSRRGPFLEIDDAA